MDKIQLKIICTQQTNKIDKITNINIKLGTKII